jgi:hypothetical protein
MSSKKAMKQAQKQSYAKHRSNITNSRLEYKKKFLTKNKDEEEKTKISFVDQIFLFFYKLKFLKYFQHHLTRL